MFFQVPQFMKKKDWCRVQKSVRRSKNTGTRIGKVKKKVETFRKIHLFPNFVQNFSAYLPSQSDSAVAADPEVWLLAAERGEIYLHGSNEHEEMFKSSFQGAMAPAHHRKHEHEDVSLKMLFSVQLSVVPNSKIN